MTAEERLRTLTGKPLGRFGEKVVKTILVKSGLHYIALADIESGGAPMLCGARPEILPDFEAHLWQPKPRSVFIEVKAKHRSVFFGKANEIRHGIERRNYHSYLRVRSQFRRRCGIAIVELYDPELRWSGSFLVESLANLGEPIDGFSSMANTVFWPRKRFCDLETFTPEELLALSCGGGAANFRKELMEIFGVGVEEFQAAMF